MDMSMLNPILSGYFPINQVDKDKKRFQTRAFSDDTEALAWLKSLGLAVS